MRSIPLRSTIVLGIGLLFLGCGSKPTFEVSRSEKRPVIEQRLDPAVRVLDLEILPNHRMLAVASSSTDSWTSLSLDAGKTWKRVQPMGDVNDVRGRALARTEKGVHLLTNLAVFRSQDGGETWQTAHTVEKGMSYDLFGSTDSVWLGQRGGSLANVDSGKKLDSPGIVTSFLELPSKTLIVGSFGKGVFRSTDQGSTWAAPAQGIPTPEVSALIALPKGDVLAGTFGGGVIRSTDEGATWASSSQGLDDLEVQSLVSVGDGRVFAGAQRGLFRSDDEGRSWKRLNAPLGNDNVGTLAAGAEGTVFAGTWGNGLYRSEDRGASWTLVDVRAAPASITAISERPDGPVFVGLLTGEVFKLTPEDGAWVSYAKMGDSAVQRILVSPDNKLFGSTMTQLFRYDESRGAWVSFPFARPGKPIRGLAVDASGRVLAETSDMSHEDQLVFATEDFGQSWKPLDGECLAGAMPPVLTADPTGTTLLQGCSCVSHDGGLSWNRVQVPSGSICLVAAGRKHIVLAGSNNSSSAGLYTLASGTVRARADIEGEPKCLAALPDGTIVMTIRSDVMALAPGKSTLEKRSGDRPGCRQLIGRDDGSLMMLDGAGVHRSTDGRVWTRIDRVQQDASRGEPGKEGTR